MTTEKLPFNGEDLLTPTTKASQGEWGRRQRQG
jgi:hypothetical protein